MTEVSVSFQEVSEKYFPVKKRSQLHETSSYFLSGNRGLPAGIFTRCEPGDIFENTVESGF